MTNRRLVGICDVNVPHNKGRSERCYTIWSGILGRCYSRNPDKYPTYKDCEVSENFKTYSYFKEWFHNQIGHDQEGWELDKDILVKGNKLYSEATCCFVPQAINTCIVKPSKAGDLPVGVHKRKGRDMYTAYLNCYGKSKHVGNFNTVSEAQDAYARAKTLYLCELLAIWKYELDPKVYVCFVNNFIEEPEKSEMLEQAKDFLFWF